MGNTIGNNNFVRLKSTSTAPKSNTQQLKNIKSAADNVKKTGGSYKASNVQNVKTASVFSSQSSSPSSKTQGEKTVSTQHFTESLTGKKLDELTQAEKAQMQLVSAFIDADGDKRISEEEANKLASLDGNNKEITQADIDKLYEELGVTTEAGLTKLINDIDEILKDTSTGSTTGSSGTKSTGSTTGSSGTKSTGSTTATSSTASTTGTSGTKYVEDKNIDTKTSGVVFDEKTGTYTVDIEKYRSGKVQDDGQGGTRYPNGSYWGIVTNAYPDLKESDKEKVYDMIGEMNDFDWQNHTLHPGDQLKLPVLEYDSNGNVTGFKTETEKAKETEAPKSTGSTSGSSSTSATSNTKGTNAPKSTGSTSGASSTSATSTTKTTDTTKSTDFDDLNKWVDQCTSGGFTSVDTLDKLLDKVEDGNYDLKAFIEQYDKNHSTSLMNTFNERDLYSEKGQEVAKEFSEALIKSYGGAESKELAKYIDNICNNDAMGGFYYDGAPILAQQVYQMATDKIIQSTEKDFTGKTSLEGFILGSNDKYQGLSGWNQAKADYEENVAVMNEFKDLYEKYGDDAVSSDKVKYETYGMSDGHWSFAKNFDGENKISDIYDKMLEDGMGAGSGDWSEFHMSMYKEALARLKEYDKLMS